VYIVSLITKHITNPRRSGTPRASALYGAMAGENKGMLICFMCFFSSLGFIGFCMCATLR
jgi:hypothetical protein